MVVFSLPELHPKPTGLLVPGLGATGPDCGGSVCCFDPATLSPACGWPRAGVLTSPFSGPMTWGCGSWHVALGRTPGRMVIVVARSGLAGVPRLEASCPPVTLFSSAPRLQGSWTVSAVSVVYLLSDLKGGRGRSLMVALPFAATLPINQIFSLAWPSPEKLVAEG